MNHDLGKLRQNYLQGTLSEANIPDDPLKLFSEWLSTALSREQHEANAMVLSTVGNDGSPSSRVVLLKEVEENRFIFFTSYLSRKGREIAHNRQVALLFFWPATERQVRITGTAEKIPVPKSEEYFRTRPYESRIGAHVSRQSEVIGGREWLEDREKLLKTQYPEGTDIPLPENWGGYAVSPQRIEFWQGRAGRLHDRIEYRRTGESWEHYRLSP
ncbi:MAG: pyridoxamine 5'-phosphate oxidase [Bacteroidota bacterium]